MKFNEKLIELRKKEGLSQEELGYKLNVTRQTVSKWELGQTTPEMDKLVKMSKIFNLSVDELINESEETTNQNPVIEDQTIGEKDTKEKNIKIIIVGALIIVIILIIVKLFAGFNIFFNIFNQATDTIDQATNAQENIFENYFDNFFDIFNKTMENNNETEKQTTTTDFNGPIEVFQMTENVTAVLDKVIKSNETEERKITVKYEETETQDTEEIKNLKSIIDESGSYEITLEYDEEGYINEVIIEKVVRQLDISKFNNNFKIYSGTNKGGQIIALLDNIITSNKTKERKITVKYKETETKDESEIKNIKRDIDTFNNYEVTFEYDADGFINEAIIEKF